MKNMIFAKRGIALLTVAIMLLSVGLSTTVTVTANEAVVNYATDKNSGRRDEVCITLDDTRAETYYGQEYSYEELSVMESDALLSALRNLMTRTHAYKASYNDCRDMAYKTDCQNGDGTVVLLYTSCVVKQSDFIGSGSIGWNREHVWPKSLGGFKNDGAGADLHHVRPDDVTTNARRDNKKYGNVEGGTNAAGSSLVSGAVGGTYQGNYYEPLDNVKGDVARICLYVYARYGGELSKCSSMTNVFQSVDVLLEWCEMDPVDTWEMGRNEVVAAKQGNRNVFIDYPEYAWLLFDREVPEDMVTPSAADRASEEVTTEAESEGATADETASETRPEAEDETATETVTETDVVIDIETAVETTEETVTEGVSSAETETGTAVGGCGAVANGVSMVMLALPATWLIRKHREDEE